MYYEDHGPPHVHAEHQGHRAVFNFAGNVLHGSLDSMTASRLVRDWIVLNVDDLHADWELAQNGQALNPIPSLE
jgi:hypothetical protein